MKNMKDMLRIIKKIGFRCEAGPIDLNQAFIELENSIKRGPKFQIGERVWFHVTASINGIQLQDYVQLYVINIYAKFPNQNHEIEYEYDLSQSTPMASMSINICYKRAAEDFLYLTKPESQTNV